jgi:hypothetical protein
MARNRLNRRSGRCPLWVISGQTFMSAECPIYPRKRILGGSVGMSARCQQRTWTATRFGLAVVSVKRVVRTYRHIKTGWCSTRRVAHLGMAAAGNRHAADDGASNLWLCSSGSLRVTLLVLRSRAGRYQRECKHNGRNTGYDCFHRDPLTTHERLRSAPHTNRQSGFSSTHALVGNTVRFGSKADMTVSNLDVG